MDAAFPDTMLPAIARFFESEGTRMPGQDFYPAVFANEGFFPLQRPRELAAMIQAARAIQPKVVMEIGADKGGGFYHWVKCLPSVEYAICNEIRGTPYAGLFEQHFSSKKLWFIPASSRDYHIFEQLPRFLNGNKIDVLFIDGDKSAFHADFMAYLPSMSPGGLVFFHDIQDAPCRAGFEKSRPRGKRSYAIIDTSEGVEAAARKAAGEQPRDSHDAWLMHWAGRSCGVGVIEV